MSSPLALGAVSAVLRNLLDNGMVDAGDAIGSTVAVSALAPDLVTPQADDPPQLNLFLYQVTPNASWSNRGLPSRSGRTGERLGNAPLALDLHYLLTAYGQADFQAEILLGYAMHLLHERPVLDRAAIRRAFNGADIDVTLLPQAFQALRASDLADQVELIRITPTMLGHDEMTKLWSAIQTHYRLSSAYQVSVVLIEGTKPGVSPRPVLSRGPRDSVTHRERGIMVQPDLLPPIPTLLAAAPPHGQAAARLGETVTLSGHRLAGTGHRVLLRHRLLAAPIAVTPGAVDAQGHSIVFALPNNAAAQAAHAAGQLAVSLELTPPGATRARETNAVPLLLAPVPVLAADAALGLPAIAVARTPSVVTVALQARPRVRPGQPAVLALGSQQAVAGRRTTAAAPLVFEFPASLPAGAQRLRLRVDGTDSLLIDLSGPAPVLDPTQIVTVPA